MKPGLAATLLIGVLAFSSATARAAEVAFERVAEGVYSFVGELGARTRDNEGLNATLGLVVTPQGAVLIDSGATWNGARQIEAAVRRITPQPVRWVLNTGGQDHRWLGNGWFAARGAELIGHAAGAADMRSRGGEQLAALRSTLGELAEGTAPVLPTRWLEGPDAALVLGGVRFEFSHRGGAHTPGDMLVWLPEQRVLFSGDVVYVDRMLGVLPVSNTKAWLASFAAIEALAPAVIVPGHGAPCGLVKAAAHTRDLLKALRTQMQSALDAGLDVSAAARRFEPGAFATLRNAAELLPGNASRVYLELERE